ncbi:MAG: hypothetical protein WCO03_02125 [bacterium]
MPEGGKYKPDYEDEERSRKLSELLGITKRIRPGLKVRLTSAEEGNEGFNAFLGGLRILANSETPPTFNDAQLLAEMWSSFKRRVWIDQEELVKITTLCTAIINKFPEHRGVLTLFPNIIAEAQPPKETDEQWILGQKPGESLTSG